MKAVEVTTMILAQEGAAMQPRPILQQTPETIRLAKEYQARERAAAAKLGLVWDEHDITRLGHDGVIQPIQPEEGKAH